MPASVALGRGAFPPGRAVLPPFLSLSAAAFPRGGGRWEAGGGRGGELRQEGRLGGMAPGGRDPEGKAAGVQGEGGTAWWV